MNVLSLFDGMSCGQIALNRAGVKYDEYFASEIDHYAMAVTRENYPHTTQLGDVTKIDYTKLPFGGIDLLMGGSPCQGFSVAGKQLDFDDPRSKLFFEFVRLKDELKPKYFLMENVPMKQESQDIITKYLGVKPVTINSSLFSAQNRKRLYWTNIPFDIPTEDKGIILQDILEDGIANEAMTNQDGKAHCITARYNGAVWWNSIQRKQRTMVQVGEADNIKGFDSIKRIYSPSGKSPTLTTMQGGHREPKVAIDLQSNGMQWRKLTPVECERLQTVPDNYTDYVSNSQRYKMLGNGWTIDVIAHILRGIK
jgi:DNA-cytosine methyltransferase